MGAVEDMFPRMRDTKSNVMEEIQSALFYSVVPLTIRAIRDILRDRHEWVINSKTVHKFTVELVAIGKVVHIGKIVVEGVQVDGFSLSEGERNVRSRGCSPDAAARWRTVHGGESGSY